MTSGTSYCCKPTIGKTNPCVSKEKTFVSSLGEEAFIAKGPCVDGKRNIQYCSDENCNKVQDTQTEPCKSITKKGTKIPGFGTSALIVGLSIIAGFYFFANRKNNAPPRPKGCGLVGDCF